MRLALLAVFLLVPFAGCIDEERPTGAESKPQIHPAAAEYVSFPCPVETAPCRDETDIPFGFVPIHARNSLSADAVVLAGHRDTPPSNTLLEEPLARPYVYWSDDGRSWSGGVVPDPPLLTQQARWNAQWVDALQDPTGRIHVVWDMESSIDYSIAYATAEGPGEPWTVTRIHTGTEGRQPSIGWYEGTVVVRWHDEGSMAMALGGPEGWTVATALGPTCLEGSFRSWNGSLYLSCDNDWLAQPDIFVSLLRITLPSDGVRLEVEELVARSCDNARLVRDAGALWWWTDCAGVVLERVEGSSVRRVVDVTPALDLAENEEASLVDATLDQNGTWHLYLRIIQTQSTAELVKTYLLEDRYVSVAAGTVTGSWIIGQGDTTSEFGPEIPQRAWTLPVSREVWTLLGHYAPETVQVFSANAARAP